MDLLRRTIGCGLVLAGLLFDASTPAHAGDGDTRARPSTAPLAASDARFTLRATRMDYEPHSTDGAIALRSSFQPLPPEPVADTRFALGSRLRAKTTTGSGCSGGDGVFADGFE